MVALFVILSLAIVSTLDFYFKYTVNAAVYLSGILSLVGGISGAFGAYFIAIKQMEIQSKEQRKQLEYQLQNQDRLDRERILLNMKLERSEDLYKNIVNVESKFYALTGIYSSFLQDLTIVIAKNYYETLDYEVLKNGNIIHELQKVEMVLFMRIGN